MNDDRTCDPAPPKDECSPDGYAGYGRHCDTVPPECFKRW